MIDPEQLLARRMMERVAAVADDLARIVTATRGTPLAYLMEMSRERAEGAMAALLSVEPTEVEQIRRLQDDARQYTRLVTDIRDAIIAGEEAAGHLDAQDREYLAEEADPNEDSAEG